MSAPQPVSAPDAGVTVPLDAERQAAKRAAFVEAVELRSTRSVQLRQLLDRWCHDPAVSRFADVSVLSDRRDPGHFVVLLRFPSEEAAAEAEQAQCVQDYAVDLVTLLDDRPRFLDLDALG